MNLAELKPRLDTFIQFVKKYPAPLRPTILTFLLEHDGTQRGLAPAANIGGKGSDSAEPAASQTAPETEALLSEIAVETKLPVEVVGRIVGVLDSLPIVRRPSPAGSKARRQIECSVLYIYLAEKLGREGVPIEELRTFCQQKRCYDGPNFVATFRRKRDWLQAADVGRSQEYVLTGRGREAARQLIRDYARGLPSSAEHVSRGEELEEAGNESNPAEMDLFRDPIEPVTAPSGDNEG